MARVFNRTVKSDFPLKAKIFHNKPMKDYSCELSTFTAEISTWALYHNNHHHHRRRHLRYTGYLHLNS
jgi:hypothetical protein